MSSVNCIKLLSILTAPNTRGWTGRLLDFYYTCITPPPLPPDRKNSGSLSILQSQSIITTSSSVHAGLDAWNTTGGAAGQIHLPLGDTSEHVWYNPNKVRKQSWTNEGCTVQGSDGSPVYRLGGFEACFVVSFVEGLYISFNCISEFE